MQTFAPPLSNSHHHQRALRSGAEAQLHLCGCLEIPVYEMLHAILHRVFVGLFSI